MEDLKLKSNKLVNIDYLVNKIRTKEDQLNTPMFSFLIGAGCSISSKIPSGNVIMRLCSQLAFLDQHEGGNPISLSDFSTYIEYIDAIDNYISKTHEINKLYQNYKENKENDFRKTITNEEVIKKIPYLDKSFTQKNDSKVYEVCCKRIQSDNLYGKWFETFSEDPRERQKLIETIIDYQEISGEYIIMSHLIKSGVIHNVFTTNFDDILNECLSIYAATKARVFSHNETARYVSINSKKPNIIKLHGDYLFENIKNTTEETGELERNMEFKLNEALLHLGLVVIGYNGADYSIMNSLRLIKMERPFPLIWCVRNSKNLHWRVVHLINTTPNSYVVEVEDFTTLMVILWARYGKGNFDLRIDAEQRQKKVTEALQQTQHIINTTGNLNTEDKKTFNDTVDAASLLQIAKSTDDIPEKISLLNRAVLSDNTNPEAFNLLGVAYLDLARTEASEVRLVTLQNSLEQLKIAIKLNPNYYIAYGNMGNSLRMLASLKSAQESRELLFEAKKLYEKVIELNPESYLAYGTLCLLLRDLGNTYEFLEAIPHYEEGITIIKKAIQLNGKVRTLYSAFGGLTLTYGTKLLANDINSDKAKDLINTAIKEFSRAIEIDPKSSTDNNNLGAALYHISTTKSGDEAKVELNKSVSAYKNAIYFDPNLEVAYTGIIRSLEKLIVLTHPKNPIELSRDINAYQLKLAHIRSTTKDA